ncbi:MAG: hypothetical protein J7J54_06205 [Candidatus Omnitrophica bacterium]|nr:hypothetical protein [Candidatus Omnitrophota bacterium]
MKRNNYMILLMSSIFTVLNWNSTSALLLEDENCVIPSVFQGQKVTNDDRFSINRTEATESLWLTPGSQKTSDDKFFIKGEKDPIPSTPWNEGAPPIGYTPDETPVYPVTKRIEIYVWREDPIPSTPWNEAAPPIGYTSDGTPVYPVTKRIEIYVWREDPIPSTKGHEGYPPIGYTPDGTPIYPPKGHIIYY